MEGAKLVPNPPQYSGRHSTSPTSGEGHCSTYPQMQQPGCPTTTSRVGYLRDRFRSQGLSGEASKLLQASNSSKNYDSLFNKWAGWCSQRNCDPIMSDVSEVANFLAHFFQQGYQYRSLNAYLSAMLGLKRPSRSSDLCSLDISHRRYVPEGVVSTPTSLAKQSRPERELSFPAFTGNAALCSMQTLQAYESMTKNLN